MAIKPKKEASAQAKGRSAKALRDSDEARNRIISALELNGFRGGDGTKGTKPAAYGNEATQKKQGTLSRLQSKMYGERKNPANALSKTRTAKAKDSKPPKKSK